MEIEDNFKIVSRVYGNNFSTVTFIIFNSDTGELKKEVIDNEIAGEHDRNIRAETAENIQHEIMRLSHEYPSGEVQHAWNHAIATAAECCNGYAEEK